jgi:uncharacterized repeat protein (TIGR03803 family)
MQADKVVRQSQNGDLTSGKLVPGRAPRRQERRSRTCFPGAIVMRNYFLGFGIILTLALAACSWQGVTPPSREAGAFSSLDYPATHRGHYKVIYEFPGGAGGKSPGGGLAFVNGVMFGTTGAGGYVSGCDCGTVFAGTKVIYSFKGASSGDGEFSVGTLLPVGDELYGATMAGGRNGPECLSGAIDGCGTVYEVDAGGNERVVHRFKGGSDGNYPLGGLVSSNGTLYGVTNFGGVANRCHQDSYSAFPPGCGVIYAIDSSGREKVIYRFKGLPDGAYPNGRLLALNDSLYGMTYFGGNLESDCDPRGCGTVFRVTASGKESVIYSFKGGYDGANPYGSLASLNGFLWGTTSGGGNKLGTIFKMSTSGQETIVHRFEDVPDGARPAGLLAVFGNTIYGTTGSGGIRADGTLFSVTSKGERVLHSFGPHDKGPGGLVYDDSTKALYGETGGGRYQAGTIFQYRP